MKNSIIILMVLFCFNCFADRWHLIKDGKVVNSIEADDEFISTFNRSAYDRVIKDDFAGPGWSYDHGILGVGAKFTPPVPPPKTAKQIQREDDQVLYENKRIRVTTWCDGQTGIERDRCDLSLGR